MRPRGRGRGDDTPTAIIGSQIITANSGRGGGGGGGGRGGDQPDIRVTWHKHRGPGDITYDTDEIRLKNDGDPNKLSVEAKTNAYFSASGEHASRAGQRRVGQRRRRRSALLDQRVRGG